VAAAIQQMTSRVDEISRQVAVAAQVTREAVGQADASRETLKSLTEATLRIGDVVQLINDIAGQTNLLALNATIEAERAGEVGRDFAVVAGEVKALATQTGSATQEIGGQIEAVRSAASESISAIGEVACIIGRLDEVTAMIAAALEEQSAAAREIAASLQAVSSASSEATAAMQHVVSGSDEASAVSQQVLESASNIGVEAERLRGEVDQFLIAVRDEASNRRRYERLPGNGAMAMLATCDGAAMSVVIQDISRGGIAVACDWPLPAGSEVTIGLQGAGGVLYARTVRSGGGVLALVFQQDTDTLAKIDRVLPRFEAMRRAA
jgi:methyl-accepting chemotaxis protein